MKKFIAAMFLVVSANSFAEMCTFVIRDYNGYEYQNFTRSSYTYQAACADAQYDCQRALSDAQSVGRYYDSSCREQFNSPNYPTPYPPSYPTPYPPSYPTPYPPQYPQYPSEPDRHEPRYPREPDRREPQYPREPDRREPQYPREPDRREPQDPRGPDHQEPREPHGPRR